MRSQKMRNLRDRYTYKERSEYQITIGSIELYIRPLLLEKQGHVCNMCKQQAEKYDIDHKIYNPMMTINELQLLCVPCHKSVTNYIPFRNR